MRFAVVVTGFIRSPASATKEVSKPLSSIPLPTLAAFSRHNLEIRRIHQWVQRFRQNTHIPGVRTNLVDIDIRCFAANCMDLVCSKRLVNNYSRRKVTIAYNPVS